MKLFYLITITFLVLPNLAEAKSMNISLHPGEMDSGYIMAWTKFDGQMDRCMVDTGARTTVIKSHILPDAPAVGQIVGGGLIGVQSPADLVNVSEIETGNWVKNNLTIRRTHKLPTNCILGNEFFMHESLSIDYANQIISTEALLDDEVFPILHFKNQWFGFTTTLDEKSMDSLFDTGAGLTLIDETLVEELPQHFEYLGKTELVDSTDTKVEASLYKMKSIRFGKWQANDVVVIAYPFNALHKELPSIRIVIGHNIIKKHHWYFNNILKQWGIY